MTVPLRYTLAHGAGARRARRASRSPALRKDKPRATPPARPRRLDRGGRCRRVRSRLIRDYIRHVGGDPAWYRGRVPPHFFPQWGFPLGARALEGARLPARAR